MSGDLAKFLARLNSTREDLERLIDEKLDHVDTRLTDLEDVKAGMGDIRAALEKLAARQDAVKPAPVDWTRLDDEQRAEAMTGLTEWLRRVLWARHPSDADHLNWCWTRHPDVVDALTTAWHTHLAAWAAGADPQQRAIWTWSYRPSLVQQLRESPMASCTDDTHREPERPTHNVIGGQPRP